MKLTPDEHNVYKAVEKLLELICVPFTKSYLKKALIFHPDSPSLSAIGDLLNDMKIPNIATRLNVTQIQDIPLPALTFLSVEGKGGFVVLKSIDNSNVEFYHPDNDKGWRIEPINEFLQKWTGYTLLIEPDENSSERSFTKNIKYERIDKFKKISFFTGISSLLCVFLFIGATLNPISEHKELYIFMLTKFAGFIVCCLLFWSHLDNNNSFINKVCQLGKNTSCKDILNSKGAFLFSWISWTEIGLFYFIGGLFFLFSSLIRPNADILIISKLTYFAAPYVIYSIYYQAVVAKQWCILCLLVQLIICLEFIVGFLDSTNTLNIESILVFSISYLIMPISWIYLKPMIWKLFEFDLINKEYSKIKFNTDYLSVLATNKRVLPQLPEDSISISIGNENAEYKMIVVSNPTCESCAKNHDLLRNVIAHTDELYIQIIFAIDINQEDIGYKVAQRILCLSPEKREWAYQKWFEQQDYDSWIKILPKKRINSSFNSLERSSQWLHLAGVRKAPTIFLNEVEYPTIYNIEDLGKVMQLFKNSVINESIT